MALTVIERARTAFACAAWVAFLIAATASPAHAQGTGLGEAVLGLWNNMFIEGNTRVVRGQLFGVCCYLSMVLGMVAQYCYRQAEGGADDERRQKAMATAV